MKASVEGWGSGLVGVAIFSASLPATRLAVIGFPPLFLTCVRGRHRGSLGCRVVGAGASGVARAP